MDEEEEESCEWKRRVDVRGKGFILERGELRGGREGGKEGKVRESDSAVTAYKAIHYQQKIKLCQGEKG